MSAARSGRFGGSRRVSGVVVFLAAALAVPFAARARPPARRSNTQPPTWLGQEMEANDGANQDHFGSALAVSGATAVVGARLASVGSNDGQGAAYVFTYAGGAWSEQAKLTAPDGAAGDEFGAAVAIDGDTVLAGAPFAGVGGNAKQGAVYVYSYSGGGWSESQKITVSGGGANDWFGTALALDGDTVLVGAPFANKAYFFTDQGGTWQQGASITDSSASEFGVAVALDGATAVVGAPATPVDGALSEGEAYVFGESGGTWSEAQSLTASDGAANDAFGNALALGGTTLLIGSPYASVGGTANQGALYAFSESGGTWSQDQKITASDGAKHDLFGSSIALRGDRFLCGASDATVDGNPNAGAAYLFSDSGGAWALEHKFSAIDGQTPGFTGASVASGRRGWFVGASLAGDNAQGAFFFYAGSDLGLVVGTPTTVPASSTYLGQAFATNDSTVATPAVAVTMAVPAAASFISASATQGSCSEASGTVTCDFGPLAGNGGTASADVVFKATGGPGGVIDTSASVVGATPPVTADASLTIGSGNTPPVAYDGVFATVEDKSGSSVLVADDADGDSLTYAIVGQPAHGSVTLDAASGKFTYDPDHGYSGSDSFTFNANDGAAASNTATVRITVIPSSNPPLPGSGGGGFGWLMVAALGLLALSRRRS